MSDLEREKEIVSDYIRGLTEYVERTTTICEANDWDVAECTETELVLLRALQYYSRRLGDADEP